MLDNHKLSEFSKSALRFQPYENRIKMFDNNCLQCPYSFIKVKIGDRYIDVPNTDIAVKYCIDDPRARIIRGCSADGGYTLEEITSNTCAWWYPVGDEDE